MVDKIDRPDPAHSYRVDQAPQAGDEREQQNQQAFEEDEYSDPGVVTKWRTLNQSTGQKRQIIRVEREAFRHIWFRQVKLQPQHLIIEADVELKNGHYLKQVLFLVADLDYYGTFKNYHPGQEVLITMISHQPVLQLSILESKSKSHGLPPAKSADRTQMYHVTHRNGTLNIKAVLIYTSLVILFLTYIILLLRK